MKKRQGLKTSAITSLGGCLIWVSLASEHIDDLSYPTSCRRCQSPSLQRVPTVACRNFPPPGRRALSLEDFSATKSSRQLR